MSYNVYTAEYEGHARNHMGIFVKIEDNKNGKLYHVVGSILQGMKYEVKSVHHPTLSNTYVPGTMVLIGTVKKEEMPRFEAACEEVEVPGAQLFLNGQRKDPSKPVRRCREWVDDAREKLITDSIVQVQGEVHFLCLLLLLVL